MKLQGNDKYVKAGVTVFLTVLALIVMFVCLIAQVRKAARLTLEKETADAANRAKREELEQRLALQKSCWKRKNAAPSRTA